jgi:hypothetical protein
MFGFLVFCVFLAAYAFGAGITYQWVDRVNTAQRGGSPRRTEWGPATGPDPWAVAAGTVWPLGVPAVLGLMAARKLL